MQSAITPELLYWSDLKDNRIGPLMRELTEALHDSGDPAFIRTIARRMRLLASSLESMSRRMEGEK